MDEVAIFNRSLTQDEILDYYNVNYTCSANQIELLTVPSYPYVDASSVYTMTVTDSDVLDLKIDINGSLFILPFVPSAQAYQTSFNFTTIGDYPFIIFDNSSCDYFENISGVLLVRNPYYINVRLFWQKSNSTLSLLWYPLFTNQYKNDFAYITLEYADRQFLNKNTYNPILERFLSPLSYQMNNKVRVFHAPYIDGEATIKLWDNNQAYGMRLVDGIINFDSVYAIPNVSKSYGINSFLGIFSFNGSDQTYDIYVSKGDIYPYKWLMNWALIILLLSLMFIAICLMFVMPDKLSFVFAFWLVLSVSLIFLRAILWMVWQ
jgi:hypothetical protein